MEDEDFRHIVIEFVQRLRQQLDEMERVHEAGDYIQLSKLAHWLKGSGGTAGFGEFTEPARCLEEFAKQGETTEALATITLIRQLTERIEVPGFEGVPV
jgi:HPt (histidine-containing phosphotransfer) domain-containing protein